MSSSESGSSSATPQVNNAGEAPLDDFARFLYEEDKDVFQNVHRVKRLLKLADSRFRDDNDVAGSFFNLCTHDVRGDCWAFASHHKLNTVLTPHDIEMIAIHEHAFALQTLENTEDILIGPDDIFTMCVCNWLLRTHHCISKVAISVATVARFHAPLFWRLLSLNVRRLDKVELIGLPTDQSHFRVSRLFESATQLSDIVIVHITLDDNQAELLCRVLEQNEGLKRLVLKTGTTTALQVLSKAFLKYKRSTSFELREKIPACEGYENAVAGLLDTPFRTLYLEAPCNWAELFKRLRYNTCLYHFDITDCDFTMYLSLTELSDDVLNNTTLRSLEVCVNFPQVDECATEQWRSLTQSIGQNRGLKFLSFAKSNFSKSKVGMVELAEATAQNKSLVELSVAECNLTVSSVFCLLTALSGNKTMKTLHIGTMDENEVINSHILERVANLGLRARVSCVYMLRSDWQLERLREAYETACSRSVRVVRTSSLGGEYAINIIRRVQDTLAVLNLKGVPGVPLSSTEAVCLADIFAESKALQYVVLLLDTDASVAVKILKGLTSSRKIYSVIIGGTWNLSSEVAIAFGEMLRKNSSIAELTVWHDTRMGFEKLKANLRIGVKYNYVISKVQLLYGPEKKESHNWALFQMLQTNRIVASWAIDILFGNNWTGPCMYALHRLNWCNNWRTVLCHATGCSAEYLESKIQAMRARAETEMPGYAPTVAKSDRQKVAVAKMDDALGTINKDFIEAIKFFFDEQKCEETLPPP